ncbi:MAG: pyridoxal 5'-phosphate synthase glutaminase subunit PdxT [Candidatus Peribacteraceae bacterium]|nr:pyridoxal 5'-phosphate synthase glutaminase subunit PdxT [Candidatus Peribacteraceae bacterium]
MIIGILGLQGDFSAHKKILEKLGTETLIVRTAEDLEKCDGLIIPGGESTTMNRLLDRYKLKPAVRKFHKKGKPIFGTCAGMILISKKIESHPKQFSFNFIDIEVNRNAYGRQIDSFEEDIDIPFLGKKPYRLVFIRAPKISKLGKGVESLVKHNGDHIIVRQDNVLAGSFHPEMTADTRMHEYFLKMTKESLKI